MNVGCVAAVVYDENHNEVGTYHSHAEAQHEERLDDFADSGAEQEGGAVWIAGMGTARVSYRGRYQPGPFRVH